MDGAPRYGLGVDERTSTLIDLALAEDIGPGDVTSSYFVPEHREARGLILAKSEGVVAGVEVAKEVFKRVDNETSFKILLESGNHVSPGSYVIEVRGKARSLLTAERVALNFLQRLSGVATKTRQFVELTDGTGAKILDTRKTTPGWRTLEKAAVIAGGGANHRMGLYDRAMVKDNHLVAEGGIEALQESINQLRADKSGVEVELEADRLDQVKVFLKLDGVDHILLDKSTDKIVKTAKSTGAIISGPIPLPTKRSIYTVLRSPHVDKKSREQFQTKIHKRMIDIINSTQKTVESLMKLDLPAGVDIEIKV